MKPIMCRWRAIVGLIVVTGLASLPGAVAGQQGDLIADGSRVYGNTCGGCHNARSPLERSDREWVTIINHMRIRANLTGKQTRAVLAFLQATNNDPRERVPLPVQGAGASPSPAPVSNDVSTDARVIADGEALIMQKACIGCHVVDGTGGQVGPSLDGVIGRRGAQFVRRKLIDPTVNNAASMMPNFGLSQEQMDALVAYLATLNGGPR